MRGRNGYKFNAMSPSKVDRRRHSCKFHARIHRLLSKYPHGALSRPDDLKASVDLLQRYESIRSKNDLEIEVERMLVELALLIWKWNEKDERRDIAAQLEVIRRQIRQMGYLRKREAA